MSLHMVSHWNSSTRFHKSNNTTFLLSLSLSSAIVSSSSSSKLKSVSKKPLWEKCKLDAAEYVSSKVFNLFYSVSLSHVHHSSLTFHHPSLVFSVLPFQSCPRCCLRFKWILKFQTFINMFPRQQQNDSHDSSSLKHSWTCFHKFNTWTWFLLSLPLSSATSLALSSFS